MNQQKIDEILNSEDIQGLFSALLKTRNEEEMKKFLCDLLTIKEIETFAMRLKAARMLDEGIPYTEIERKTGLSSATIARVSEYLKYGYDGYKLIISRTHKKRNN
jgi:TrpR-related protein YerC/YecD